MMHGSTSKKVRFYSIINLLTIKRPYGLVFIFYCISIENETHHHNNHHQYLINFPKFKLKFIISFPPFFCVQSPHLPLLPQFCQVLMPPSSLPPTPTALPVHSLSANSLFLHCADLMANCLSQVRMWHPGERFLHREKKERPASIWATSISLCMASTLLHCAPSSRNTQKPWASPPTKLSIPSIG